MADSVTVKRPWRRKLIAWHRWVGLISVLFVLVIALTGIVLNHSVSLDLDRSFVKSRWLMTWYGLEPEGEAVSYRAGEHWVSGWGGETYLDGVIVDGGEDLLGAGLVGGEIAGLYTERVRLFDEEGGLVEVLDSFVLPEGEIRRGGSTPGGGLVLETDAGVFELSGLEAARRTDGVGVEWFEAEEAPGAVRAALIEGSVGEGLPIYRVLLDLHSGRFFGTAGVVLYDVATVAFLFLAISGVWIGVTRRKRNGSER